MNILIEYNEGGLGDTLAILPFAKDFHDQYPDYKLFIFYPIYSSFQAQRNLIFLNNPDISIYNNEHIDLKFFYDVPANRTKMEEETIVSKLYKIFKEKTGIEVKQKTFYIPWYFYKEELDSFKSIDNNNKPICLINSGYHPFVSSKNYGFENFEKIITALKDDILFLQVGETQLNGFIHKLHTNVLDLRNKLNLRQLAVILYYSRFVLCHVSGLNIFSGIPSNDKRTIFTFCGNRELALSYQQIFNTDFLKYYILQSKNNYNCFDKQYCEIQSVTTCKHICNVGDELVCQCLNDIDPNFIINKIKTNIKE